MTGIVSYYIHKDLYYFTKYLIVIKVNLTTIIKIISFHSYSLFMIVIDKYFSYYIYYYYHYFKTYL